MVRTKTSVLGCYKITGTVLFQVNSEDEPDDVYHGTGCRNVSHCQQRYYDHPHDHSQPTFEKLLKSILK